MKALRLIFLALVSSSTSVCFAQAGAGVPVFSPTRYAIISGQIEEFANTIKQFEKIVAVAKDQIAMLDRVSSAIQDVKRLAAGGVQGVVADFAKQAGLGDILNTGMQIQALAGDSLRLYNSVLNLPQDAKRQLEDIGLSSQRLQEYIAHGIKYDAMQTLDVEDWKAAAANPHSMFVNGTLGTAMARAQVLTNGGDLRAGYAAYLGKMTPGDRERLSPRIGLDLAAANFDGWLKRSDARMSQMLVFQKTDQSIAKTIEQQGSYSEHTQKRIAADASGARLESEALRRRNDASGQEIQAGSALVEVRTRLEAEARAQQQASTLTTPE